MELSEDEVIQNYAKRGLHCNRNTLLPYKLDFTCFSCEYNVIKPKHELSKIQRKKNCNHLKYAELKIFCICVGVYKTYEGIDYDKIYEVLSTLKNKKLKVNNILNEKYKHMLENSDFEQDHRSKTAENFHKIGHDSIRLMKWLIFYDRFYHDNLNYFVLMGSFCKYLILNEIS